MLTRSERQTVASPGNPDRRRSTTSSSLIDIGRTDRVERVLGFDATIERLRRGPAARDRLDRDRHRSVPPPTPRVRPRSSWHSMPRDRPAHWSSPPSAPAAGGGLAAGFGDHSRVQGYDVAAVPTVDAHIAPLADAIADLLGQERPTGEVRLDRSQASVPYGEPTDAVFEALRLVADTEGVVLDPVYSGRAMAGLIGGRGTGEFTLGETTSSCSSIPAGCRRCSRPGIATGSATGNSVGAATSTSCGWLHRGTAGTAMRTRRSLLEIDRPPSERSNMPGPRRGRLGDQLAHHSVNAHGVADTGDRHLRARAWPGARPVPSRSSRPATHGTGGSHPR
ncbi:MAG: hypothetical protein R2710_16165 [Acidimicrobiales bacterium]